MNLTPKLAAAMLTVWERRSRDPRGMKYDSSVLDAACGAPDHFHSRETPEFRKNIHGKWRKVVPTRVQKHGMRGNFR